MNAETGGLRSDDRTRRRGAGPTLHHRARGGLSVWSILSGVLVAFGAFVVLAGIIGAVLAVTGLAGGGIRPEEATTAGIGGGIAIVLAQFLAYLWGGYTAGRMARGAGAGNGLAVAVVALVLALLLGVILAAATRTTTADVQQLPLPLGTATQLMTGVGIGLVAAMLLGGTLGGVMGARWHTRLENLAVDDAPV